MVDTPGGHTGQHIDVGGSLAHPFDPIAPNDPSPISLAGFEPPDREFDGTGFVLFQPLVPDRAGLLFLDNYNIMIVKVCSFF